MLHISGGAAVRDSRRTIRGKALEYLFKPVAIVDRGLPVIDLPDARPFASGNGPHDYLCGKCRNVLMSKVEVPKPQRAVIVCGKCRTPNLMEPAPCE